MVNKHTGTHSQIFMDFYGVYLLRIFLEFFSKPGYSTMIEEQFQTYTVKITAVTFVSQKNWICSFLLMPPSKTLPEVFEDIFSWGEKGRGEDNGVGKDTKINKGIDHKFW